MPPRPRRQRQDHAARARSAPFSPAGRKGHREERRIGTQLEQVDRLGQCRECLQKIRRVQAGSEEAVQPVGGAGSPEEQPIVMAEERQQRDKPAVLPQRQDQAFTVSELGAPGEQPCRALEWGSGRIAVPQFPPFGFRQARRGNDLCGHRPEDSSGRIDCWSTFPAK